MAPELALGHLPAGACRVLDPMMGSGTIPVLAALNGHVAYGYDTDPLALLIASVWGRSLWGESLHRSAKEVSLHARKLEKTMSKPVVADEETQNFIDYWFD